MFMNTNRSLSDANLIAFFWNLRNTNGIHWNASMATQMNIIAT